MAYKGIGTKCQLSFSSNIAPDVEVPMSIQFVEIFRQELQAAGVDAPELVVPLQPQPQPVAPILPQARPVAPAIRLGLSHEALSQSCSLQQYTLDKTRETWSDSGILTGQRQAGYLWKTQDGLSGKMTFATQSGSQVTITAGNGQESSRDVSISVIKDGREYSVALEELAEASFEIPAMALLSLESGQMDEVLSAEYEGVVTYSARGNVPMPPSAQQDAARISESFSRQV